MSNRSDSPGSEGKKNGAFSGALGGSFGLLRCCKGVQKIRGRRKEGGKPAHVNDVQVK